MFVKLTKCVEILFTNVLKVLQFSSAFPFSMKEDIYWVDVDREPVMCTPFEPNIFEIPSIILHSGTADGLPEIRIKIYTLICK
jgi:hypothetical protein